MSLPRFLVHRTALALSACSAIAVASCSDPVPPSPQGAFAATLGNATGATCPAPGPVSIGAVTKTDKAPVVDGDNGISVSCKVVPISGGFGAEGALNSGSMVFNMTNVSFQGNAGTGTVRLGGAATVGVYASQSPCTFTLIQAEAGRIWTEFTCPDMKYASALTPECAANGGVVVFENCLTE